MASPLDVLKKIGTVLAPVAPWIATAFGGPMAGAAVSRAVQALNVVVKPDASTADKVNAIDQAIANGNLTPDQLVALKQADEQFQLEVQKAGFDHIEKLDALTYQDVQSARQMQVQTKSVLPSLLAVFTTLGFFGVLIAILHYGISAAPANHDIELILITALQAGWLSVLNFFFGSSQDSHRKTELLAQAPPVPKG